MLHITFLACLHVGSLLLLTTALQRQRVAGGDSSSNLPAIYVYELPPALGEHVLRPACQPPPAVTPDGAGTSGHRQWMHSWETMYSTEASIAAALTSPSGQWHHQRTWNPHNADLFFVPAFPSCHLHARVNQMNFTATAEYMASVLEHVRARYPFFNASGGADHFGVLSHDLGRCLLGHRRREFGKMFFLTHSGETRARFEHYVSYTNLYRQHSNKSSSSNSASDGAFISGFRNACFDAETDVVIPPETGISILPSPAFSELEAGTAATPVSSTGMMNDASPAASSIVVQPHEVLSLSMNAGSDGIASVPPLEFNAPPFSGFSRRKLAVFRGSIYAINNPHSAGSRQRLFQRYVQEKREGRWRAISLTVQFPTANVDTTEIRAIDGGAGGRNAVSVMTLTTSPPTAQGLPGDDADGGGGDDDDVVRAGSARYRRAYFLEMLNARFCFCLPGFAPWTVRLFEAVMFGCIPVVLDDRPDDLHLGEDGDNVQSLPRGCSSGNRLPFSGATCRDDDDVGGGTTGADDSRTKLFDCEPTPADPTSGPLVRNFPELTVHWAQDIVITLTKEELNNADLADLLTSIPASEVQRRQRNMQRIRRLLTYTRPPAPAIATTTCKEEEEVVHGTVDGGGGGGRVPYRYVHPTEKVPTNSSCCCRGDGGGVVVDTGANALDAILAQLARKTASR